MLKQAHSLTELTFVSTCFRFTFDILTFVVIIETLRMTNHYFWMPNDCQNKTTKQRYLTCYNSLFVPYLYGAVFFHVLNQCFINKYVKLKYFSNKLVSVWLVTLSSTSFKTTDIKDSNKNHAWSNIYLDG